MQKYRFIRLTILLIITLAVPVITPSPALASGPSGSASEAEMIGCQSEGYDPIDDWALRYGGEAKPGMGHVKVQVRPSPSDPDKIRVCAQTYHGSNNWGDLRVTGIEVGSEPKGDGIQDRYFWDIGDFRYHSDGRAITPGEDRCVVIHAFVKSADGSKTYGVWIDQNDVPDSLFCN